MKSGYTQLAAAVISRAVLDLADAMEIPRRGEDEPQEEYEARIDNWKRSWWRTDSALFLTDINGEWARSRMFWCEAAGMSSSAIRDKSRALVSKARAGAIRYVQQQLRGQVQIRQ